jgi:hypothetical protein
MQYDIKYNEDKEFYSTILLFPKGLLLLENKKTNVSSILKLLKPKYP